MISVEHIAKRYEISHRASYDTLRESIIRGLTKPFRRSRTQSSREDFWALQDVTFNVQPGERIGIIGRNGAGKSTLLKILSQIVEPTQGKITLHGRVASLLEVGTGFHPELTGRENIFLNGAILGMKQSEIKKKFDEIVTFAEIEKFLDTPVKRYSSGMYVRLAFAVAAHLEPEILVVDEVLAVGDAQFQKKCLGKMQEVGNSGRTILFVSHNMSAISSICSRVILLENGKVKFNGAPQEAISMYSGASTQKLSRSWKNENTPLQNSIIKIEELNILGKNGEKIENISCDQDFKILFSLKTLYEGGYFGLTLLLFDQNGSLLFGSLVNSEILSKGYKKNQKVQLSCAVPGHLLNDQGYRIGCIIYGKNFSDSKTFDDLMNFSVNDTPTLRNDFLGKIDGPLRPKLQWQLINDL